jgi:hypothetical protein
MSERAQRISPHEYLIGVAVAVLEQGRKSAYWRDGSGVFGKSPFMINEGKMVMTIISRTESGQISRGSLVSRRSVLSGAVCASGAATMLAAAAIRPAQAAKISPKVVKYQDTPKGDQMCSNCKLFVAPDSCQTVDGTISPNGWCMLYQKA